MTVATHIGQYRIVRKIGAGGMGLVFLGEHTLLGRRAAIKTLLPSVAANHEIVERFFNEARAAAAISDPGVIQIFDFGYHVDGTAYIVMELLEGESLSARIDRLGRLSVAETLRIGRQIAGSLAAAHARDIVHRDLKPDNIFLVGDAEAQDGERTKVLDFGICKVGAGDPALTQAGVMVGTPVYMAPEQCLGADNVDHRADIYAFGCLVFHMLTGRPPFVGEVAGELVVAHLEEEPPAPSTYAAEVPRGVDALVLRCLAKPPSDRYQSMTELARELGELYSALGGAEAAVAAVPSAIPLGKGFRSVFDGNVAAFSDGALRRASTSTSALATPMLRPWRGPAPTPRRMASSTEGELGAASSRRVRRRVVLGCALAVGAVLGLGATMRIVDHDGGGDGRGGASVQQRSALLVEAPPGALAGAGRTVPAVPPALSATDPSANTTIEPLGPPGPPEPSDSPGASSGTGDTAAAPLDCAGHVETANVAPADSSRSLREAKQTVAPVRQRLAPSSARKSRPPPSEAPPSELPPSEPAFSEAPPSEAPPSEAPSSPPPSPAPSSPPSSPAPSSSPSPPPPSSPEDLYDTR